MEKVVLNGIKQMGLTEGEASAFTALLETGEATAPDVAKKTGMQKSAAYFCLERLSAKGFATETIREGRRFFRPVAEAALSALSERQKALREGFNALKNFQAKETTENDVDVRLFKGWKGVKSAFHELLCKKKKGDYVVFSTTLPENVFPRFRRFIKVVHKNRIAIGIRCRILISGHLKKTLGREREKERLTTVKYAPLELAGPSIANVYGNQTLLAIWAEEPCAILIKSDTTASAFMHYFDLLWKNAKR